MNRLAQHFFRYSYIYACLLVVIFVQSAELVLLSIKYDLFTGGFLQPYSFTTFWDRFIFILLAAWFDIFFYGLVCGALWIWLGRKLGTPLILLMLNYVCAVGLILTLWLAAKFKLLAYFNDTLDFVIAKNLAGGSLSSALSYVANEAVFLFLIFAGAVVIYFGIRFFLRPYVEIHQKTIGDIPLKKIWGVYIVSIVLTVFAVGVIGSSGLYRYGMIKKTSYVLVSSVLDIFTDWDLDGYGVVQFPVDSSPLDATIHPFAIDIPNNGIDENGLGGDSVELPVDRDFLSDQSLLLQKKNIVLVVLESARADMLHTQVNGKDVTPNINMIAAKGSSFSRVYSHTGFTTTSLKALFSRSLTSKGFKKSFPDFLEGHGYNLNFISGQDESFGNVANIVGMEKGDQRYLFDARSAIEDRVYASTDPGSLRLSEQRVFEAVKDRLAVVLKQPSPFFLYINFQAAHFPYSYPSMPAVLVDKAIPREKISQKNQEWLANTYWNALYNADQMIGQVVDELKNNNIYENTLFIVTADHGESLFRDGFLGHGHAINDDQTNIPLVLNVSLDNTSLPMGQISIADLLVSSLRLDQFKVDSHYPQTVFQIVGPLSHPKQIAFVYRDGDRLTYDFRINKYRFDSISKWKTYKSDSSTGENASKVVALINYWESIVRQLNKNP